VVIRPATEHDWDGIWPIWQRVVATGDTYTWAPGTPEPEARAAWMLPPPAEVWVAEEPGDGIVATAQLKPNLPPLGAHVANAGFMVHPDHAGSGRGRRLAEAVIARAVELGYEAMQFNAVVATNHRAVALWRALGFAEVGRIPDGFAPSSGGRVDLLVMHRRLHR
jgi:L-amino acid N-acyltransferase YncA